MSAVRSLIPTCEPPLICLEMASSEKCGSAAPEPQRNIPKTVSHWCPSLFSISVRRTLTKSNSWRKGFIDLQILGHSPLRETKLELEAGTWRQGLKQRQERNVLYWFIPHSLLTLLELIPQNQLPRGGTTHRELGLLTSWDSRINHYHRTISTRQLLDNDTETYLFMSYCTL